MRGTVDSMDSNLKNSFKTLESWFERQKRVLPWRSEPTPYRVWISEIMLQQTQVATVIPYFERFMVRFSTVEALAQASLEEVLLQWAGLGYYSRARNLHQASKGIVERGWPQTREEWLEIPGVGNYTAGAILSIAFDQPEAILDGNVERVISRVMRVGRAEGDRFYKENLWKISKHWVERSFKARIPSSVLNQALMELGATVCFPKGPLCVRCPLERICRTRRKGDFHAFPPPRVRPKMVAIEEELHCVLDGRGRVLLEQRKSGEWRSGLWDFVRHRPCGRFKNLGVLQTKHVVTNHQIQRKTKIWVGRGVRRAAVQNLRWVSLTAPEVPLGSPCRKVLERVGAYFFKNRLTCSHLLASS